MVQYLNDNFCQSNTSRLNAAFQIILLQIMKYLVKRCREINSYSRIADIALWKPDRTFTIELRRDYLVFILFLKKYKRNRFCANGSYKFNMLGIYSYFFWIFKFGILCAFFKLNISTHFLYTHIVIWRFLYKKNDVHFTFYKKLFKYRLLCKRV